MADARSSLLIRLLPAVLLAVCAGLISCGEKLQDPKDFYRDLVNAVRKHDGTYMYDVLDSSRRAEIDTLIGMQMANLDKIPAAERARWDSLKGKSKREIYGKILGGDNGVSSLFLNDYTVLHVDTMVVITVQHQGQPANVMYLRPRGGSYVVSQAPRPPMPPGTPGAQHPPVSPGQGQPAPAPGAPGMGAPPNGAPGAPGAMPQHPAGAVPVPKNAPGNGPAKGAPSSAPPASPK